ncbi:hypothetical protein SDC9_184674 [bioreactor metagenome]|uniref:Uncharacterized protein n=1 Tax=bioreactor metagenome TaxID=1076179 RepID=A0A645HDP3_9ZZZZ
MGDHHQGMAAAFEVHQSRQHLDDTLVVQVGEWFVQHQQCRIHRQNASDGQPAFFPARQGVRSTFQQRLEFEGMDHLMQLLLSLIGRKAQVFQTE